MFAGKPGGDRGSQRTAEYNDWLFALCLFQIFPGGLSIAVAAFFRYLAFALAIPPVVDNENVETEPVEYFDGLKAVRNIASITMKKKQRRFRVMVRDKPAVKLDIIFCNQFYILVTETDVFWCRNQVSARHIRVIDKICLHVIDIEA